MTAGDEEVTEIVAFTEQSTSEDKESEEEVLLAPSTPHRAPQKSM